MKIKTKVVREGKAECVCSPMGECGLEGFYYKDIHRYELMETDNGRYYRIYPDNDKPDYYETCGPIIFLNYFKIIN